MDIRITNNNVDYGMSVYKMTLQEFGCKEYHPFIIVNKWDNIYIDLNDETPKGIIRQLLPLAAIRPVFSKDNVNAKVMQLLCEIYPDESAELRSSFIKDKKKFREIVEQLCPEVV